MKHLLALLLFSFAIAGCSRVSQDRLEGNWDLVSLEEKGSGGTELWNNLLDTIDVKVSFLSSALVKTFYFEGDSLIGFSSGDYILLEEEKQVVISDTSLIFNAHGLPLDVISLKKNEMILEGKYYLHAISPSLPADTFITLEWTFEQ